MSTHNICICWEIRKILCGYPLLSLVMNITLPPRETRYRDIGGCEISEVNKWRHPATGYVLYPFLIAYILIIWYKSWVARSRDIIMNMLKQIFPFSATLWRWKRHLNQDDLFFISFFAFSTATSPIMVNDMLVYLLPMDGLIFSSTVFIVVSVYQQKITPPDEI